MSPVVSLLVNSLQQRQYELEKEVATLRQRLQHSHTTINDLRYAKKELTRRLLQQSA
jgi:cell division protein FtsL